MLYCCWSVAIKITNSWRTESIHFEKHAFVHLLHVFQVPFDPGQVGVDFLHAVAHIVEYVAQRLVHIDDDSQIGGKISLCPIMNSIANCAYDWIGFRAKQASFLEQIPRSRVEMLITRSQGFLGPRTLSRLLVLRITKPVGSFTFPFLFAFPLFFRCRCRTLFPGFTAGLFLFLLFTFGCCLLQFCLDVRSC